ncbi:hypothetical protein M23134_07409 [Microscilla marina ATCC 23134]|uniref:Uncharacterized protein n=1 Tax=Microscilla marina ATCC 23134 TaxID=313606 RepID=A1ZEQ0_MICM2|nr:hypothetical protein M23134_07409 [Microscilla marina ATCC 23134]
MYYINLKYKLLCQANQGLIKVKIWNLSAKTPTLASEKVPNRT